MQTKCTNFKKIEMLRGEGIKAFAKAVVQLKRQYAAFLEDFQKNYLVQWLVLCFVDCLKTIRREMNLIFKRRPLHGSYLTDCSIYVMQSSSLCSNIISI